MNRSFAARWKLAKGLVDFIYVAEDLGTQDNLLMSPATWRRFLRPWMRKMIDLAHSFRRQGDAPRRWRHPQPIAGPDRDRHRHAEPHPMALQGMEREGLARDFGKSVVFHGAVDNQQTLPFGTPDDVKRKWREHSHLRQGKGYVVAPCHNLQPNTPTANILALYEAVQNAA